MLFTDEHQIKDWIIQNADYFYEREGRYIFWNITNLPMTLAELKERGMYFFSKQGVESVLRTNLEYFYIEKNKKALKIAVRMKRYFEICVVVGKKSKRVEYYERTVPSYTWQELMASYYELMHDLED